MIGRGRIARRTVGGGRLACLALVLVAPVGCNMIDTMIGGDVVITEMVAGESLGGGALDCWLTLDFKRLPKGTDPTDVRVRFESVALLEPAEFDWPYIASRDVQRTGDRFGGSYREVPESQPDAPPPLGVPLKVRYPLSAKPRIENAPSTIWLEATVLWGGVEQDTMRRPLDHVYTRDSSYW